MDNLVDAIYLENVNMVKNILEHEPSKIDEVDEHGVLMAFACRQDRKFKTCAIYCGIFACKYGHI